MASLNLPRDDKDAAVALRQMITAARSSDHRAYMMIQWQYIYWYLKGCRHFNILSWNDGALQKSFQTPDGNLQFVFEGITQKYQEQLGRLLAVSTDPLVKERSLGLDQIRKRGLAKVVLDFTSQDFNPGAFKMEVMKNLLMYGMVGFTHWAEETPYGDVLMRVDIVPAWQLLPIPGNPSSSGEIRGVCRNRLVLFSEIKEKAKKLGMKLPTKADEARLNLIHVARGSRPRMMSNSPGANEPAVLASLVQSAGEGHISTRTGGGTQGLRLDDKGSEPWVEVSEFWTEDAKGRLCDYAVMLGDWLSFRLNYEDLAEEDEMPPEIPIPVGIARFTDVDGFYSLSWASKVGALNSEIERMLSNLFENVQELTTQPMVLTPSTWGLKSEMFESRSRPKHANYEIDYTTATQPRVETIAPASPGDFPGRVAMSAWNLMKEVGGSNDLLTGNAPGRVDNTPSLGLLYETSNIPLKPVIESLKTFYGKLYRALLYSAKQYYDDRKIMEIASIDESIMGVSLDPKTGAVQLGDRIPGPFEVICTIAEGDPRLKEARRQEAREAFQMGMLSLEELIILNYKEQLGLAVGGDSLVEEYRKGMFRNLIQFNDGKTPQKVTGSAFDNHEFQLAMIGRFMAKPEFSLADTGVRAAFEGRLLYHQTMLGKNMPQPVPAPDDVAALYGSAGSSSNMPADLQQAMQAGPPPQQ